MYFRPSFSVVFNQSTHLRGLWPPLPSEVAVVYPHPNRLLLFRGSLLHGVLVSEIDDRKRERK
jgi:hypothetical protein